MCLSLDMTKVVSSWNVLYIYSCLVRHDIASNGVGNIAGSSTFGKTYAIALPCIKNAETQVHFHLMTITYETFYVNFTSHWRNENNDFARFQLSRNKQHVVKTSLVYSSDSEVELRWTYFLTAIFPFQVTCYAQGKPDAFIESFLALPLEAWGKVYVVSTTNYRASLQIINGAKGQKVTVLLGYVSKKYYALFKNIEFGSNVTKSIYLESFQALSIQLCHGAKESGAFTGSNVNADNPIAVVCGSCYIAGTSSCKQGLSLDMPPTSSEFLTSYIAAKPEGFPGYFLVIAFEYLTSFSVSGSTMNADMNMASGETFKKLESLEGPHVIKSKDKKKPILVVVYFKSTCRVRNDDAITSLSYIIPTGLLMDNYYWQTNTDEIAEYVLIVYKQGQSLFILMDMVNVERLNGWKATRYGSIHIGQFQSGLGDHQLYSINSFRYAAYLFGYKVDNKALMHMRPAGIVARPGYSPFCEEFYAPVVEGDLIDNDCDGLIDEEKKDSNVPVDNDYDQKVEEDYMKGNLVNGFWSVWVQWSCESETATRKYRSRYCNNPAPYNGGRDCDGPADENKEANCYNVMHGIVDGGWAVISYHCLNCHIGDVRARVYRQCIDPEPKNGGKPCTGPNVLEEEYEPCVTQCAHNKPKPTTTRKTTTGRSTTTSTSTTTKLTAPWTTPATQVSITKLTTKFITITQPRKLPGVWGLWSEWKCIENCTVTSLVRTRTCEDPPEGPRSFECPGFMYELGKGRTCNVFCETLCPTGRWGFNCSKTCRHCGLPCDKETGNCGACLPGYRYPHLGCQEVCGEFTFGYDCSGDCFKKCGGHECIEKITGQCPYSA
ncbi:uncharacterized protein LOC106079134 isoform X2 [Biomphalaria glabrata]|uniref:Uncharacterized protein LOC106079134 isoform X2 n=1 Tax=Biomphalaria glabrata TaxID=6526 RepID=A0A9W2ZG34_BIOGL|nr:uncharacterized protein LOC106079134 isoform X2 [Biomphalaria glabrata]